MMKTAVLTVMIICPANLFAGLLISEIASGTSGSDWVEIRLLSGKQESADISGLFVTMYYGQNEALAKDSVTICSYNRPETSYDDRFAVIHLTDAVTPDETDRTGDTNRNGYLDLYCNNYTGSLWNGEGCVALDTNDDPSDGMLDFAAWSDGEGDPSETIGKYVEAAAKHGQWEGTIYDRNFSIKIPKGGLNSSQSIIRLFSGDANRKADFAVTDFQTPGRENACGKAGDKPLISLNKRKITAIPGDALHPAVCAFYVNTSCDVKMKVFTDTGQLVYESDTIRGCSSGASGLEWPLTRVRSGLYPALLEVVDSGSKRSQREKFFFIVMKRR